MITIFKYEIALANEVGIVMPKNATIIALQAQGDTPCIWTIVDTKETESTTRHFVIHGTGHEINHLDRKHYIGTCQTHNGSLVWHIFEVI